MEKKYLHEDRYKKVPRSSSRKRRVVNSNKKNIQKKKISNNRKYRIKPGKFVRFLFCLIILILIIIVTRLVTMTKDEPFIPVFFNNEVKENTDNINIAIYDNTNIGVNNSVITEIEEYIYPMLLNIKEDYTVQFELISNISKINNKEYEIKLDTVSGITAVEVKDAIDTIIKEKNKHYYKVENVDKVEIKSKDTLLITLKQEDEYFIYNLNIPIYIVNSNYGIYSIDSSSNENKLILNRKSNANKEYLKNITVIKVENEEIAIEMYKQNKIDVFFSSSNNSIKMLGKYEYDIKSYNNGEGIYLMFNPLSDKTKEKYIRQIIAYSIDRENILSEVGEAQGKIIDLPYIFDEEKYKYDVYAADNILLSNGYKKENLYYTKSGKIISLNLMVNEDDEEKINIANKIKNDLLKVGINLNVDKLSEKQIEDKKNTKEYDLLLASVYVNENPNINYLDSNIRISNEISNQMNLIKNEDISNIKENILKLKTTLSDDIAIYGIYSKNNYVIYKKGLDIFKEINYMNLFNEYFNN